MFEYARPPWFVSIVVMEGFYEALFLFHLAPLEGTKRNKNRAWYKPSMKRLPLTFLIDWHLQNQPTEITSVAYFFVCKFSICRENADALT